MSQQSRKIRRTIKKKFRLCPALLADMRVELAGDELGAVIKAATKAADKTAALEDFTNSLCRALAEVRVAGASRAEVQVVLLHFVEGLESD